jgi:hypothetical protein
MWLSLLCLATVMQSILSMAMAGGFLARGKAWTAATLLLMLIVVATANTWEQAMRVGDNLRRGTASPGENVTLMDMSWSQARLLPRTSEGDVLKLCNSGASAIVIGTGRDSTFIVYRDASLPEGQRGRVIGVPDNLYVVERVASSSPASTPSLVCAAP